MRVLARALRTALAALVLLGWVHATGGLPAPTTIAGSSGQPGDIDVG
jgi:hypothetical protein